MEYDDLFARQTLAMELALKAGAIIKETCGKVTIIDEKGTYADLVTEKDKQVEEMLLNGIKKKFPNDKFIGEESTKDIELTDDPTWVVDPIDGTTNFVHTFPHACTSIGFTFKREVVMGVIYDPFRDHLYTAIKGKGAKLVKSDPTPVTIHVRECRSLKQALVGSEIGSQRDDSKKEFVFKNLQSIAWKSHGMRMMGSCALSLCAVAVGNLDAFYEVGPYIWDYCAGVLILTEAGGYVCDTTGGKFDMQSRRIIAACSEKIAQEIANNLVVQIEFNK